MKPTMWRDALRDSELDRTAKLVGFVLSTYMNGSGSAFPAKTTIARGASLSTAYKGSTAVDEALNRLEAAGFLIITRRRGRKGFSYEATIPREAEGFEEIPRGGEGIAEGESLADEAGNPSPNDAEIPRDGAGESVEIENRRRKAGPVLISRNSEYGRKLAAKLPELFQTVDEAIKD